MANCPICGQRLVESKKDENALLCHNCKKKFRKSSVSQNSVRTQKEKKSVNEKQRQTKAIREPKKRLSEQPKRQEQFNEIEEPVKKKKGCLSVLLKIFAVLLLISFFAVAWLPAIGAAIFFVLKKDRPHRKRNIIISILIAITSLFAFVGLGMQQEEPEPIPTELTGITVEWDKTEYEIGEQTEVIISPVPSDVEITSLEMSETAIAEFEYKDGKAIVTFVEKGNASIYFTANGEIQSDAQEISVMEKAEAKIHFLDVEQGLSVLVQSGEQNLIFDGGGRSSSSFVVAYLKEQGITTLDYLISSHYDEDHLAGLIGCLNVFDVKNVIGSDYVHDSDLYQSFMNKVEEKNLEVQSLDVGTTFELGTAEITILAPTFIDGDSNDNSVAIKINVGDNSFIFTGDSEHNGESAIINSDIDISCDVLCVGHHGASTSTSELFLEYTTPKYAVISCGKDNEYGHPDKEVLDRISDAGIELFRTDKQGTIIAESDGKDITWSVEPCNDFTAGIIKNTEPEAQAENDTDDTKSETNNNSNGGSSGSGGILIPDTDSDSTSSGISGGSSSSGSMVWIPQTGKKYHSHSGCSNMKNPSQVSLSNAQAMGYEPCGKCYR